MKTLYTPEAARAFVLQILVTGEKVRLGAIEADFNNKFSVATIPLRAVSKILQRLREAGYVATVGDYKRGGTKAGIYQITSSGIGLLVDDSDDTGGNDAAAAMRAFLSSKIKRLCDDEPIDVSDEDLMKIQEVIRTRRELARKLDLLSDASIAETTGLNPSAVSKLIARCQQRLGM
jgi:DNA-binding PadR family transcriptional regulator